MGFSTWIACCFLALPLPASQTSDRDNVVILLDASGSMERVMADRQTQKMEAAKRAIGEVLQTVPQETHTGLLVFSGKHKAGDWVYPLGPRDDAKLIASLRGIEPDGGTPLGEYMKAATDRLLEERKKQNGYGSFRLLVVTDGEADKDDAPLLEAYLPQILSRGIVIDVIGVAMSSDHSLARRVHSYRRADDLPALRKAVSEVFAEVGRDAASAALAREGYELLAAIPDEAALPILAALTRQDDEPIGVGELRTSGVEGGAPPVAPGFQGPTSGSTRQRSGTPFVPIFIGLFVVIFLGARRRRRAQRRA